MVDYAMKTDKVIGMIQSKENKSLYSVGCLGKINQYYETDDGRYLINLAGVIRYKYIKEEKTNEKFRKLCPATCFACQDQNIINPVIFESKNPYFRHISKK